MHQIKDGKQEIDSGIAIPSHGIINKIELKAAKEKAIATIPKIRSDCIFRNDNPMIKNDIARNEKNDADTIK